MPARQYVNENGVGELSELFKNYADEQVVGLSQSEYDALTPEEQMNGAVYFIDEDDET